METKGFYSRVLFFLLTFTLYVQGVLLPDRQTLRGDSTHKDKHYQIGNDGAQTSAVGARGHKSLGPKASNDDKKRKKRSIRLRFSPKLSLTQRFSSKKFLRVTFKKCR